MAGSTQHGIDHVITSGTFSLDGGTWEVDNNVWIVGDEREVVIIDAEAIVAAVGDRRVKAIVCTHAHDDHANQGPPSGPAPPDPARKGRVPRRPVDALPPMRSTTCSSAVECQGNDRTSDSLPGTQDERFHAARERTKEVTRTGSSRWRGNGQDLWMGS
ncbi:hypothetical protein ACL02T_34565 [Pseudonocardia sp. RS010]|uniref:hypothetical protein n=1 Tax=Pseudonocardia sp. RS010 TaxID=3385979 RepID=UPI0039A15678